MKLILLLLGGFLLSYSASAKLIENIYIDEVKITYTYRSQMEEIDTLSVYLNRNSKTPSYSHQFYSDEKLIDAAIADEKLIILRKIKNTFHLLILNKTTGEIVDNFWAIFAALSPSGRFIVYTKWQYRNDRSEYGIADGITVVYDVTKTPSENRTLAEVALLKHSPFSLTRASRKVGIPVYPLGDYNKPEYGWITDRSQSSMVFEQYFWYQNDAFIFAVAPKLRATKLVNVIYDHKLSKFVVKVYKATTKDFTTGGLPEKKRLEINRVEKIGEHLKLFTKDSIIRLDNLNQLEQIE